MVNFPGRTQSPALSDFLAQRNLTLLWQILSGTGFPNQFFCDSWVVGFWRGRPWLAGRRIGRRSLDAFSGRFWFGWVTRRGADIDAASRAAGCCYPAMSWPPQVGRLSVISAVEIDI